LLVDEAKLYGEHRLLFSIIAENAHHPFNYARQDSNL